MTTEQNGEKARWKEGDFFHAEKSEHKKFLTEESSLPLPEKHRYIGTQMLLLIQITVCGLIVLLAFLLKLLGVSLYENFAEWYKETLNHSIVIGEQYEDPGTLPQKFSSAQEEASLPEKKEVSEKNSSSEAQQLLGNTDQEIEGSVGLGKMIQVGLSHAAFSNSSSVPVYLSVSFAPPLEEGTLTSEFGERENPFTGETEFHPAVDIAAKEGEAVCAVLSGEILKAEKSPSYGNYILIDHGNGIATRYAHLSKLLTEEGKQILRGEEIGLVGQTGNATGAHLHLELLINGVPYDPSSLLEGKYA